MSGLYNPNFDFARFILGYIGLALAHMPFSRDNAL
jgi:hypothetical protein